MEHDAVDTEVLEQATARAGAVVMGRRLFDVVDGPDGWSSDMGYGAQFAGAPPFFVVTHSAPKDVRLEREGGLRFTFVNDVATAVEQASVAAGDRDVVIMGGGDVIAQAIELRLADELHLHLAPMVLGGGTIPVPRGHASALSPARHSPVEQCGAPHLRARGGRRLGQRNVGCPLVHPLTRSLPNPVIGPPGTRYRVS